MKKIIFGLALATAALQAQAQQAPIPANEIGLRAIGSPHKPKVQVSWNHYNDVATIQDIMQRIAKAYPELAKVESIGKSYQGTDIMLLTITDFKVGKPDQKPGFYIDGNIHSNELQGSEFSLYTAWYLTEMYSSVQFIKDLLKDKVFYIAPTINPDARDNFIKSVNTNGSPRSGMVPFDDDNDGQVDEDNFDDIDGDGEITMMRRKNPLGRLKVDPNDPNRLIPAKADEPGEYEMLGNEGIDNDGDGLVNEDRPGSYDPNRDWGWNWQPDYIQGGAYKYPFSFPENEAVRKFIMAHPNIAGAQSFHNYGGMFLRGPGAEEDLATYDRNDINVYDVIGKKGEELIPGYSYFTIYKDLYTVYGGEIDWYHGSRGIFTFSNELMTSYLLFNKKSTEGRFQNNEFNEADRFFMFGDAFVKWHPFKHPIYGDIEIGGFKKNYIRNHPGFLIETDAHRNMAFMLYHAWCMPKLEIAKVTAKKLDNGFTQVDAVIYNARIIPTHSSHDIRNKIERPDYISLKDPNVVAGMVMQDVDFGVGTEQKMNPATLEVPNLPGMSYVNLRWILKGSPSTYTLEVNSAKGGIVTASGSFAK
jgi:hypothetical protein